MHVVFSLAQRITVLAQGTPLVEDTPDNIKGHPKVREAYLGESHDDEGQRDERQTRLFEGQEPRRHRPGLPLGLGPAILLR
jgi:ABC-type proline/glycine betaine transport system ATPase subunit